MVSISMTSMHVFGEDFGCTKHFNSLLSWYFMSVVKNEFEVYKYSFDDMIFLLIHLDFDRIRANCSVLENFCIITLNMSWKFIAQNTCIWLIKERLKLFLSVINSATHEANRSSYSILSLSEYWAHHIKSLYLNK